MFELRDYQSRLATAGDAAIAAAEPQRPVLVAPTGAGKTVILAELARLALCRDEQVVVICHRGEILEQIAKSLQRHLDEAVVISTIVAGSKPRLDRRVIVGMVPTMVRRLPTLLPLKGCTLLADECHHAPSSSWRKVIESLAPQRFAGLTATPVRPDGRGLGDEKMFDLLVNGPQPAELMEAGALCRYKMFASPHSINSKGLKKKGGDYSVSDMEKRIIEIQGFHCCGLEKFNSDRLPTICVAVSVEHAHMVAGEFAKAGIKAAAVDGFTKKEERRNIFDDFRSGKLTVLVACAVIDEGLDVPQATCLQVLRPTASIRLWRQLVGRVLRPAPGKEWALILDHTDNWDRLPFPDEPIEWKLNNERQQAKNREPRTIDPETNEVVPVETEIEETGKEIIEITPEAMAANKCRRLWQSYRDEPSPTKAREILNELCVFDCSDPHRVSSEEQLAKRDRWLPQLHALDDLTLEALEKAAALPAGWARGQMMVRLLLTDQQRRSKWLGIVKSRRELVT